MNPDKIQQRWAAVRDSAVVTEGGCLIPQQAPALTGYVGVYLGDYQYVLAHRLAVMAERGPIEPGMHVDHLCVNPPCCNPEHLEVVTCAENQRRKIARTAHCRKGHDYTEENTYWNPTTGKRRCRTCARGLDAKRSTRPDQNARKRERVQCCGCGKDLSRSQLLRHQRFACTASDPANLFGEPGADKPAAPLVFDEPVLGDALPLWYGRLLVRAGMPVEDAGAEALRFDAYLDGRVTS